MRVITRTRLIAAVALGAAVVVAASLGGTSRASAPQFNLPAGVACNTDAPQALHGTVMNALFGDGSVRAVNGSVSSSAWNAAVLPDDGNAPGDL